MLVDGSYGIAGTADEGRCALSDSITVSASVRVEKCFVEDEGVLDRAPNEIDERMVSDRHEGRLELGGQRGEVELTRSFLLLLASR